MHYELQPGIPQQHVQYMPQQQMDYMYARGPVRGPPPVEYMQQQQMRYQPVRQYMPQHQHQHVHMQHEQMQRGYPPPQRHQYDYVQAPPQEYGAVFSGLPNREPMMNLPAPSRGHPPPGYENYPNYQHPQGPPSGGEYAQGIDI